MAPQRLTLHLDPVRSAENLATVIDVLARNPAERFPDLASISRRVQEDYTFTDRTEPLSLARLLGLLAVEGGGYRLSADATSIAAMRPASRADVLHFLLATAWHGGADPELGCAWTYRAYCDRLWTQGSVRLDVAEAKSAVADLLSEAQEAFPEVRLAALSPKSVLGMRKWLEPLDPSVVIDDQFRRRDVCSPELVLMAVGHVAQSDGAVVGSDLPITPARREAVCRICLLEPAALDRALDRTIPGFPSIIEPGTRSGAHGRFVRLKAMPTVERIHASR